MKNLVDQLNAEIKKAFENGDYEIAEIDSTTGMIKVKIEELEEPLILVKFHNSCTLFLVQSRIEYRLLPLDILVEKLAAFEAQNKAKQIAELEAKLSALKGGNNE